MISNFFSIKPTALLILLICSIFISCDDEISEVGSDSIIGSNIDIREDSSVSIETSQVNLTEEDSSLPQTNNLEFNLIGKNTTTVRSGQELTNSFNILTSISDASVNIEDTEIEGTDSTTNTTFKLESATLVLPFDYTLIEQVDDNIERYSFNNKITNDLVLKIYQSEFIIQENNLNALQNTSETFFSNGSSLTPGLGLDGSEQGSIITSSESIIINSDFLESSQGFENFENFEFENFTSENTGDTYNFEINTQRTIINEDNEQESEEITGEDKSALFPAIRIPLNDTFLTGLRSSITSSDGKIDISLFEDSNINSLFIDASESTGIADFALESIFVNAGIQLQFTRTRVEEFTDTDTETITEEETLISTLELNTIINTIEKEGSLTPVTNEIILEGGLGSFATINLSDILTEGGESSIRTYTSRSRRK